MGLYKNVKMLKKILMFKAKNERQFTKSSIEVVKYIAADYQQRWCVEQCRLKKEFEIFLPPEHCASGMFRHMYPKPESSISFHITPSLKNIRIHYCILHPVNFVVL